MSVLELQVDTLLEDALLDDCDFVMYRCKVELCTKAYPHDFTACPFLHPGERARRRDPRTITYSASLCPDVKKDKLCTRGTACPYSHNIFEYFMHPDRYRTRMCDFAGDCKRKLCFFAHNKDQLRVTAKSLAAQQANSNSGKGKGGKGAKANNSISASGGSNTNDLLLGSEACGAAAAAAAASPASTQLLQQMLAAEQQGSSAAAVQRNAELLQLLRAAGDSALDEATAAAIMHLLVQLETQQATAGGSGTVSSKAHSPIVTAAGSDQSNSISLGSSPGSPVEQLMSPAAAASAAMLSSAAASSTTAGSRGTVQHSKPSALHVAANKLWHNDAGLRKAVSLPANSAPGMWGLASPAAGSPCMGLLSPPGMQCLMVASDCGGGQQLLGMAGNTQLIPVGGSMCGAASSAALAVSLAGPAHMQPQGGVSGWDQFGQQLPGNLRGGSLGSSGLYGAACNNGSLPSSLMSAASIGSATGSFTPEPALPVMLQQLALQQQGAAAAAAGGYTSPNNNMVVGAAAATNSPGCYAAVLEPHALEMELRQQHAAFLLLQQQQQSSALNGMLMPHNSNRGVSSMLPLAGGSVLTSSASMQHCLSMGLSA